MLGSGADITARCAAATARSPDVAAAAASPVGTFCSLAAAAPSTGATASTGAPRVAGTLRDPGTLAGCAGTDGQGAQGPEWPSALEALPARRQLPDAIRSSLTLNTRSPRLATPSATPLHVATWTAGSILLHLAQDTVQ